MWLAAESKSKLGHKSQELFCRHGFSKKIEFFLYKIYFKFQVCQDKILGYSVYTIKKTKLLFYFLNSCFNYNNNHHHHHNCETVILLSYYRKVFLLQPFSRIETPVAAILRNRFNWRKLPKKGNRNSK